MTKSEIYEIEKQNPVFNINRGFKEDGTEFFYLESNAMGLEEFAGDLYEHAREINFDQSLDKIESPFFACLGGEVQFEFIKVIKDDSFVPKEEANSFQSKLFGLGCLSVVLFLILATILGLIQIVEFLK